MCVCALVGVCVSILQALCIEHVGEQKEVRGMKQQGA
jgi:hypothetical protein